MKTRQLMSVVVTSGVLIVATAAPAAAQSNDSGPRAWRPAVTVARGSSLTQETEPGQFIRISKSPVLRIWQDYVLPAGHEARNVVVVSGNATVNGEIDGDLVVVLGSARLASTAVVRGSVVVVAGDATIVQGTTIRGDLVVVGGVLDAPVGFTPGHEYFVIGAPWLGDQVRAIVPWVTRGLLWGRPLVPGLAWMWGIVLIFLIVSLAINLLLHGPVGTCAETLARKPFNTFLTGLLVLLLTGPISVLLAASVIGIAIVPFFLCAVLVAWIIGRVGVARWIGRSITRQDSIETPIEGVRSFLIGFAVLVLLYMVPVIGLITWAMVGVFGLGAASLTFMAGLRRERPATPKTPPVPEPPVTPTPSSPGDSPADPVVAVPLAALPDVHVTPPSASAEVQAEATRAPPDASSNLTFFPRATFLDRLAALVLDVLLVLIALQLFDRLFRDDGPAPLIVFLYFVAFWAWKGTTIGGIICNLRVVRVDGAPLRFVDALVRGLTSLFSIAALGLGFLWILRDPEGQAWHDKIAGTYVVKVPRNFPLP
jgi:uncharacterized RDD family membrane protein YckC